jgi:hypothetical protein
MRFMFGDHMLDAARRELCRDGELIAVEPQVSYICGLQCAS